MLAQQNETKKNKNKQKYHFFEVFLAIGKMKDGTA